MQSGTQTTNGHATGNGAGPGHRQPPQNLEAEEGVLGGVLLDNAAMHQVAPLLRAEDFFRDAHGTVYAAMLGLYGEGRPIDPITLADELTRLGRLAAVGGFDTLARLVSGVPHAADTAYHAQIVRQKAVTRSLVATAEDLIRDCYSDRFTADQLLAKFQADLMALQESGGVARVTPIREVVATVREQFRLRRAGEVTGLSTGFPELDYFLGGLQPEQFSILAARPSMGKTALALNVCEHVAAGLKVPVLFVTLEMSDTALVERMVCARARIDSQRAKVGMLGPPEAARAEVAFDELSRVEVYFDSNPVQNFMRLVATARGLALRSRVGLVILDYLQLIDGADGESRDSRQEQIAKISRRLKGLARELKVPVLALSQLNRQVEAREDRRPRMADLRESGALEQDADAVMLLHRPEYYDANDQPGIAELILAKNRNGAIGTVKLVFQKHLTRFENLAPAVECPDF